MLLGLYGRRLLLDASRHRCPERPRKHPSSILFKRRHCSCLCCPCGAVSAPFLRILIATRRFGEKASRPNVGHRRHRLTAKNHRHTCQARYASRRAATLLASAMTGRDLRFPAKVLMQEDYAPPPRTWHGACDCLADGHKRAIVNFESDSNFNGEFYESKITFE